MRTTEESYVVRRRCRVLAGLGMADCGTLGKLIASRIPQFASLKEYNNESGR